MDYLKKKQLLNNTTPRNEIVDVTSQMDKMRSASPVPAQRGALDLTNKKIIYKQDLENLKNDLNSKHAEFSSKQVELVSSVDSVKSQVDSLSKMVTDLGKVLDVSKVDSLRNSLNDSVSKINANLTLVSDELVKQLDKLNSLESRIAAFESML